MKRVIFNGIKGKVRHKEPLKNHTTFKIGGPADFFIEPNNPDDLRLLLFLVNQYNLPIFVIGKGSNLLVTDKGINGVVVRLSAPCFSRLSYKDTYLSAGSGVSLGEAVIFTQEHGLSGAEFLAGIPGTVGGALAMNAGVRSQESGVRSIGDLVKEVTVMDYAGNIMTIHRKDIKFGYRRSSLSKYIILNTLMKLKKGGNKQIKDKIKSYLQQRKLSQDLSKPSAGCIFRNPAGHSAGRLIDLCGLKGKRIKGAAVSLKHANFILNFKGACARDVCKLMDCIRKKVKSKFNINLTPEIKIWQN